MDKSKVTRFYGSLYIVMAVSATVLQFCAK